MCNNRSQITNEAWREYHAARLAEMRVRLLEESLAELGGRLAALESVLVSMHGENEIRKRAVEPKDSSGG